MLRQQPLEKFLGKCLLPRTVSYTFVQRVLEIGIAVFQTFDHFKGLVWGNDGIFQAMESPDGHRQCFPIPCHSTAAAGGNGGEQLGICHGSVPCAVAAHAEAAQINPVGIDGIICDEFVDKDSQAFQLSTPEGIGRTLGHDQNAVLQILIVHDFGKAVNQNFVQFIRTVATLSGAVQMQKQSRLSGAIFGDVGDIGENRFRADFLNNFHKMHLVLWVKMPPMESPTAYIHAMVTNRWGFSASLSSKTMRKISLK